MVIIIDTMATSSNESRTNAPTPRSMYEPGSPLVTKSNFHSL